ncbi:MAG: hypothetical protein Q7S21_05910 [archaeon]|nr:hypothetical protein [archaeon]
MRKILIGRKRNSLVKMRVKRIVAKEIADSEKASKQIARIKKLFGEESREYKKALRVLFEKSTGAERTAYLSEITKTPKNSINIDESLEIMRKVGEKNGQLNFDARHYFELGKEFKSRGSISETLKYYKMALDSAQIQDTQFSRNFARKLELKIKMFLKSKQLSR